MKQRIKIMNIGDGISYNGRRYSDDEEEITLNKIRSPDKYIEAQISEGETLQAIALKYHCNLAELKRINHIHKENEIFARRTIKLPINPYSILTEGIVQNSTESSSNTAERRASTGNILLNPLEDGQASFNEIILNSHIAPAIIPYTDLPETFDNSNEASSLLASSSSSHNTNLEMMIVKEFTSKGADFGLKWYHLLGCVFIVAIIIPILYIIFYNENHIHDHNNNQTSTGSSDLGDDEKNGIL